MKEKLVHWASINTLRDIHNLGGPKLGAAIITSLDYKCYDYKCSLDYDKTTTLSSCRLSLLFTFNTLSFKMFISYQLAQMSILSLSPASYD